MTTTMLSGDRLEAFGGELNALRQRVEAELGKADVDYIQRVIAVQRGLEMAGRGLLFAGFLPPAWLAGTAALSLSKILDNMEIGHNVMHGQYDWTGNPALSSQRFEWDTACPSDQWRHSHNFMHHTFTNIVGKDRDIGYGILRMVDEQAWRPYFLGNPLYAVMLMLLFEYGVALHDVEVERALAGDKSPEEIRAVLSGVWRKVRRQWLKDYVAFPALGGPVAPLVFAGNATANLVRNIWSFAIIFCGHFPADVQTFTEEEAEGESRGGWYRRQMLGSANITGGKLFHLLTGNLSFQIEHHLFPDIPARRYAEIAGEVREICARYGLPYNTGRLSRQLGSVVRKIARLALPEARSSKPDDAGPELAPARAA